MRHDFLMNERQTYSAKYRIATDTAMIDGKYNDTPALNASPHWVAVYRNEQRYKTCDVVSKQQFDD